MSDYQAIGGAPAVKQAVERFYERVFADEELASYFTDVDEARLKRHQAAMVTKVLGGPDGYSGRSLHEAHANLNVTGPHFERVVGHFAATLRELGVGEEIIGRAGEAMVSTRGDVVQQHVAETSMRSS